MVRTKRKQCLVRFSRRAYKFVADNLFSRQSFLYHSNGTKKKERAEIFTFFLAGKTNSISISLINVNRGRPAAEEKRPRALFLHFFLTRYFFSVNVDTFKGRKVNVTFDGKFVVFIPPLKLLSELSLLDKALHIFKLSHYK